jgi:hypothetical protein
LVDENFALYGIPPRAEPLSFEEVMVGYVDPADIERVIEDAARAHRYDFLNSAEFRIRRPERGTAWLLAVGRVTRV